MPSPETHNFNVRIINDAYAQRRRPTVDTGLLPLNPQSNDGSVHALLFICNGLLLALTTVGGYLVNLYRKKVDALEQEHKHFVTRNELDRKFDVMQEDRRRMH